MAKPHNVIMCFIRKLKHFNRDGNLAMVKLSLSSEKFNIFASLPYASLFDYYKHSFMFGEIFTYFLWLVSLVGVAFELKHIIETNLIRVS